MKDFFLFLQNACRRDAASLEAWYRRVLLGMRQHATCMRYKALKTGGGALDPKPAELKLVPTVLWFRFSIILALS